MSVFPAIIILVFYSTIAKAQTLNNYQKTTAMVAMRDGAKLNTEIYAPKSITKPLPFIFIRTPYGIASAGISLNTSNKELAEEGYIFVFQDIRGRYQSEGGFVMQRPPRNRQDPKAIDESTDTYDTIEWLLKNVANHNGRVGMMGISYPGWLTVMGMLDPHPALKACSPQASPVDMFLGDDFHHNGAFRLSYGFEYATMMETGKTSFQFAFDKYDTYEWYLKLGALSNVNEKYLKGKIPTWNDFVNHPNYDEFWQKQTAVPYLDRVTIPTLNVAGWWDQEDFYGPLKIYEELEKHDKANLNFIVVGPWNHGGWARSDGSKLGKINFDSPTSQYFREKIQAPFFAYYLKAQGTQPPPEALTFQTGANSWKSYNQWPPRNQTTDKNFYFQKGNRLSNEEPLVNSPREFDAYISDPAKPVPYRPRPIEPTYFPKGSGWSAWLLEDQRFTHQRPDVLSFETEPLEADVVVTGDVISHLFASTTGTDSDWIVKLIDVYPEDYPKDFKMGGYQLMIANEVFRGRFRKSFVKPEALVANQVAEYKIDLHHVNHRFLKGHKIMVQVQSSWFPVIDRNPQTFVENIFKAKDSDYRVATQRIYRSKRYPSRVILPVEAQTP
ncbi:MAG: CocE/NonD family hydrolase [Acidobacteriota bacterium]